MLTTCYNCRGALDPGARFCPACGAQQAAVSAAAIDSALTCPACGSKEARRVALVMSGNVWSGRSHSEVAGTMLAAGMTGIAERLKPPEPPVNQGQPALRALKTFWALTLVSPVLVACGVTVAWGSFLFFGIMGTLSAMMYRAHCPEWNAVFERETQVYQSLMQVWDRCFLCERCGRVFDPATGRSAETIRQLLGV